MKDNINSNSQLRRHDNPRMKIKLIKGTEAWFDVDNITIHFWGSHWTGREIITVVDDGQARVVSDVRSFGFKTLHEFDYAGHHYGLSFHVGFGKVEVRLHRDGELIDSDVLDNSGIRINPETGRLDWRHAGKQLAVPLLAGMASGAAFGYLLGVLLK